MSVLETPRIYFRGEVDWDPIVTNNSPSFYDETDATTVFQTTVDKVAAFRRSAIAAVGQGTWNPHGTHRSTFYDSAVSGADLGKGLVRDDKFVDAPANFRGMLVDVEPYGAFSSQLFFDSIRFGIDGGYRILAPRTTRFTARYINFGRNTVGAIAGVASVVWQTTFPKENGLQIDAFDSDALQALKKALEDDGVLGLTIQWNAYRTIYYNAPDAVDKAVMTRKSGELMARLEGGGFQPNPARSMMVGVIGLWRKGEPVHEPGDRVLITAPGASPRAPTVASAHARVDGSSMTIDLSNSISETGLDLSKKDFGELTVVAIDAQGGEATLGSIDYAHYDQDAYLATSGIVTLTVDSKAATGIGSADLQLRDANDGVRLTEARYRAVPLVPNFYMNEGETQTARFQVYDRAVAAGSGVMVTIYTMSADGGTIDSTSTATTSADGTIELSLIGTAPGITAYVAVPGPNPAAPTQGIDPQVYTYMYVRTLPADADIARLDPTWENVYTRVLANWHAMAPCMDNWLDLGNEAQVRSFGPMLKKLTSDAAFESFRCMPVTRDMTRGARMLLYRFLDQVPAAAANSKMLGASAEAMTATADAANGLANFADLSKKMRP